MKKELPGKPQSLIKILRWTLNFNLCEIKENKEFPQGLFVLIVFSCFFFLVCLFFGNVSGHQNTVFVVDLSRA